MTRLSLLVSAALLLGARGALAEPSNNFPRDATVTTLALLPLQIQGLTGDADGNLYFGGRLGPPGDPCPIWRARLDAPSPTIVGYVAAANSTARCLIIGMAFGRDGMLYLASGPSVVRLVPDAASPPTATTFATFPVTTDAIAFDRDGNLWVSEANTAQGRIWKVGPAGGAAIEQFRIPPLRNSTALGGLVPGSGVGRQIITVPPGTPGNEIVSGGLAFDTEGALYIADIIRGALWKVRFGADGNLASPTGCDETFAPDTLCLSNVFVAHPLLEGAAGIALDAAGNIWVTPTYRQAIIVVTRAGSVQEIFRNPVNGSTLLRNAGDQSVGDNHVLEFPFTPYLAGHRMCISSFDQDTRDNSPASAGELNSLAPFTVSAYRGKISCLDQPLSSPGLPLPIH